MISGLGMLNIYADDPPDETDLFRQVAVKYNLRIAKPSG
jgi:hypothetical protein